MKNSFLDYYKYILEKVSFDKKLFSKEYKKAIKYLKKEERYKLNNYLKSKGFQLQPLKIENFNNPTNNKQLVG